MPSWPPETWVATSADTTAATFNERIRDAFGDLYRILHYEEFTADAAPLGGTWTTSAVTFEGSPIILRVWVPMVTGPSIVSSSMEVRWQRDGSNIAYAIDAFNNTSVSADMLGVVFEKKIDAPTSGSHTYGLRNNGTSGMTLQASSNSPATFTIWERGA
jgi:hypothetical protein